MHSVRLLALVTSALADPAFSNSLLFIIPGRRCSSPSSDWFRRNQLRFLNTGPVFSNRRTARLSGESSRPGPWCADCCSKVRV